MLEERQPDPDQLLARVQAEEARKGRGALKIFLGYAAGVGKTFAMLEAAQQRRAQGVDVVVACVETHGRQETEALLVGLEILPRHQLEYRGRVFAEMDIDAVLARAPQLVLVDELAHTNVPGARHRKRYLDIEELLAAGIDVYTTLNVQHLESLNDIIDQITGIRVHETIPDRLLDQAAEIELVDLPPEELIRRLEEGKVYVPDQAARAVQKFFRPGNLLALREIAMRRAAERVDEQMRAYMQLRAIPGPWPAAERLLVGVGPSPLAGRLVRAARRMASELDAEWFAVYVETPEHARLSASTREGVWRTLQLAESLGAKTGSLVSHSVADGIIGFARKLNITKVVVGKPLQPRWRELLFGSAVDQIIRHSGEIDVYVISSLPEHGGVRWLPPEGAGTGSWVDYASGVGLVVLSTIAATLIRAWLSPTNLVMLYLMAVVLAAINFGRRSAMVTALLSVLAFDFFLVPPRFTLAVADTEYLLTFLGLLVVGVVISTLVAQTRSQAQAAQRREEQTATLYALSRDLTAAVAPDDILNVIVRHVSENFSRSVAVLLPEQAHLTIRAANPGVALDDDELAVAEWVYDHGQPAGHGTDTLPAGEMRYVPLRTANGVVGVMGVKPSNPASYLEPEQARLLGAFANQAALAIERAQLAEEVSQTEILRATDRLQTALLNSISHDLRTPLSSITGVLSSLREPDLAVDKDAYQDLLDTAWEEAERLNRLVGNLLDMTRIEADALKIKQEPCDVEDLIGSAMTTLASGLEQRPTNINLSPNLPFILADFVLINQVLVNLIDNAIKYSPPGSPIDIRAYAENEQVIIEIRDRGIGIPEQDLARVFDKFYRVERPDSVAGTGLGLSISKGIVEAHGGQIRAKAHAGGGTIITLCFPASALPPRSD
jgi:two-component system sensor histidine kinase KdpD